MSQLRMCYMASYGRPEPVALPAGFSIRSYAPGDGQAYSQLRVSAGFSAWTDEDLHQYFHKTLPDGLLFVVDDATGNLVSSAGAEHNDAFEAPCNGTLGWVMTSPGYRGRGLCRALCTHVTEKLLGHGYRRLNLSTDDWRLPAIATYLRIGWRPWFYEPDMPQRWHDVLEKLNRTDIQPALVESAC